MTKLNNASLLVRAADAAILGEETTGGALAMGLIGAIESLTTPLVAVVGDDSFPFTPSQYLFKPRKTDGKVDAKLHSARNVAMMVDLYGQSADNIAPAVQTLRDRTLAAAMFAWAEYGVGVANTALKLVKVEGRSGKPRQCIGNIPAHDLLELFDKDNKPNDRYRKAATAMSGMLAVMTGKAPSDDELHDKVVAFPLTADGSDHPVFGKLPSTSAFIGMLKARAVDAGMCDAPEGRAARAGEGEGGDKLLEHAKALGVALDTFNNGVGESDIAPSRDFEAEMDKVAERWAAYRVANPIQF